MNSNALFLSALLCVANLITGSHVSWAQQVQPPDPDWLQKMYAEGWRKVQEGVLQRNVGKGQVETFGYGAEGLQWVADGYKKQVLHLEEKLEQSPNASLALTLARLTKEIGRLSESSPAAPSTRSFDNQTLESCTPSFGGTAWAGPQQDAPGVSAHSSAYFYDDCAHLGDTFATAYAHAIQGTVETTTTQSDPKNGGSSLDSQAVASVNGTTDCESWAQATVTSSELSIYYQTPQAQNFLCQDSFEETKLVLLPYMVSLSGSQSDGDPGLLVDEQEVAGDPRGGDRNNPTTSWNTIFNPHVNTAVIDLGSYYHIQRIYLYDTFGSGGGSSGNFTISVGSPGSGWSSPIVSDPLPYYMIWQGFPNNTSNDQPNYVDDPALEFDGVIAKYLRIVNPTGYLGMPEIVIYGIPAPV